LDVKRDSVLVHVRFSPQKIAGRWYESWIVKCSFHGRRIRERRDSLRKAKACAEAVATKLAHGEMRALELRGEDRRIYLAAEAQLKGLKVRLDVATREYGDLLHPSPSMGRGLNQCWENDRTLLQNFPSAFRLGSVEGKN